MLLFDYFNAAILNVRELRGGISKLERFDIESRREHNKRRADYIAFKTARKQRKKTYKTG